MGLIQDELVKISTNLKPSESFLPSESHERPVLLAPHIVPTVRHQSTHVTADGQTHLEGRFLRESHGAAIRVLFLLKI